VVVYDLDLGDDLHRQGVHQSFQMGTHVLDLPYSAFEPWLAVITDYPFYTPGDVSRMMILLVSPHGDG
jgi:hypothetical protein